MEVDFDDLDNAYEDQQLNITKDISGDDSLDRFYLRKESKMRKKRKQY